MPLSKERHIYYVFDLTSKAFKIGISNNPHARLKALQTGNPNPLILVRGMKNASLRDERRLHHKYGHHRIAHEWFHYDVCPVPIYRVLRAQREAEGFNPDGTYRSDYNLDLDPYINPLVRGE